MNKKKLTGIITSALVVTALLSGCGGKADDTKTAAASGLKEGNYKVSYDKADTKGWTAYAKIVIDKDGKITSAEYDYLDKDRKKKSEDADYKANMGKKTPNTPDVYTKKLAEDLVSKQDITKVDTVTGATHSSDNFKALVTKALEDAKAGKTGDDTIAQTDVASETASAYKDGTYRAEFDKADTKGWTAYTSITIKDGKISAVEYDYLDKDGKKKSEDAEYKANMGKKTPNTPDVYTKKLAEDLVSKQDVTKVDTVTGATHSSDNFKALAEKSLEAAKTGSTETVKVPQTDVAK